MQQEVFNKAAAAPTAVRSIGNNVRNNPAANANANEERRQRSRQRGQRSAATKQNKRKLNSRWSIRSFVRSFVQKWPLLFVVVGQPASQQPQPAASSSQPASGTFIHSLPASLWMTLSLFFIVIADYGYTFVVIPSIDTLSSARSSHCIALGRFVPKLPKLRYLLCNPYFSG